MTITVIIPTHSPQSDFITRTLLALREQDLPAADWELLIIDNASPMPIDPSLIAWHPRARIVREPKLGLTHARLCGLRAAFGELLVWVDDDNLLAPDYLALSKHIFEVDIELGAAGGKSIPEFLSPPPEWFHIGLAPLGCRDLGDTPLQARWTSNSPNTYPDCAPIGAGLVIRREAMQAWAQLTAQDPERQTFGRTGASLTSGEDNDISLTLLNSGWKLAYLPALRLTHLIPSNRVTLDYQCRITRAATRDFIRVLTLHHVSPWPPIPRWTVPLRQLKAWFTHRAWSSHPARIRWHTACGHFEGRIAPRDIPSPRDKS